MKRRIIYLSFATLFFCSGIALVCAAGKFPHLRGWLGDLLVSAFLYFLVKAVFPKTKKLSAALGVFALFSAIELVQLCGIARRYDLHSIFWQLTIGGTFDGKDILLYGCGCLLAFLADALYETIC